MSFEPPSSSEIRWSTSQQSGPLQPGKPLAAAGTARDGQQLVADQSATAVGQDRGRLIKHARYYWLLAESHLTRQLFVSMLGRIAALPPPAG
jgi:hypothetical protein